MGLPMKVERPAGNFVFWAYALGSGPRTYLSAEVDREREDGMVLIKGEGWGNGVWVRPVFRTSVEEGKRIADQLKRAERRMKERIEQAKASFRAMRDALAPWEDKDG